MKFSEGIMEERLKEEGIVPVTVVMQNSEMPVVSWDNSGSGQDFTRFFCYGCLRSYKYWWMSRVCRKIHMILHPKKVPLQMVR